MIRKTLFNTFVSLFMLGHSLPLVSNPETASFGLWRSPISPELIAKGSTYIINMQVDGDTTYWCEMRPDNEGRYTLVRRTANGVLTDMTPPDFNVRTFVHEYGGGAFAAAGGLVYASCAADGAIYEIKPNTAPRRLTHPEPSCESGKSEIRFADFQITRHGIVAVAERHEPSKGVENFLALIDRTTGKYRTIACGYDFYSSPAVSADGKKIAWISWNHPNMPWTDTELWIAECDDEGSLRAPQRLCGSLPEAIFEPLWSPDGTLYFVTDRDGGWWNVHRYEVRKKTGCIENLCPIEGEVAEPLWNFGLSTYAFLGNKIVFTYNQAGRWYLAILDPATKKWKTLHREGTCFHQLRSGKHSDGTPFVQFLEHYPDKEQALVQIDGKPGYPTQVLWKKAELIAQGYISTSQHICFTSEGRCAYGFYYPPHNKDFIAPKGEKPPLLVMIHGGPTSQAHNLLHIAHQFWTSRGFAVLDVNYGGSSGYGREYRGLLDHNWGVIDVEDCVNGALFLVDQGYVDGNKLAIRGGSAGGYTTLAALAFKDTFKAGASYYGIADITALTNDTHKFESHYAEALVGKYPEEKALWESRSPIHSVANIKAPLILFQGEEDRVVPKNQAEMIYEALKCRGVPVELHLYPGEEHGFRQAKNISASIAREVDFYLETFKLKAPATP